jgi:hypothetical protein
VIGFAGARDIERGSVVDGGPIDGQPKRDIHGTVKGHQLDRDMTLIVVLSHDQVKGALISAVIDRVGRNRSGDIDAA